LGAKHVLIFNIINYGRFLRNSPLVKIKRDNPRMQEDKVMLPKVSIIILNWNGWKDTIECLESIYQNSYPNFETIIVDNDSSDESIKKIREYTKGTVEVNSDFFEYNHDNKPFDMLEYKETDIKGQFLMPIQQHSKKLVLIKAEKNYGFSRGNNVAIEYTLKFIHPDYILLLNNDTVVDRNFLSELVKVAESNKKIGIVGPLMYYYEYGRKNILRSVGGIINWREYPGYHLMHIRENMLDEAPIAKSRTIKCDWISGAAMMIRSSCLPLTMLNVAFPFGCEDIDLCIRLKESGYDMITAVDSKMWHKIGVSRRKRYHLIFYRLANDIKSNFKLAYIHNERFYILLIPYCVQITSGLLKSLVHKISRKLKSQ
jgi:GT2 family glycosyltransferase